MNNMSTISKNNTNDGALKRVDTEVSVFMSSDEESMISNLKKTKQRLSFQRPGQGFSSLGHPMTKP